MNNKPFTNVTSLLVCSRLQDSGAVKSDSKNARGPQPPPDRASPIFAASLLSESLAQATS